MEPWRLVQDLTLVACNNCFAGARDSKGWFLRMREPKTQPCLEGRVLQCGGLRPLFPRCALVQRYHPEGV